MAAHSPELYRNDGTAIRVLYRGKGACGQARMSRSVVSVAPVALLDANVQRLMAKAHMSGATMVEHQAHLAKLDGSAPMTDAMTYEYIVHTGLGTIATSGVSMLLTVLSLIGQLIVPPRTVVVAAGDVGDAAAAGPAPLAHELHLDAVPAERAADVAAAAELDAGKEQCIVRVMSAHIKLNNTSVKAYKDSVRVLVVLLARLAAWPDLLEILLHPVFESTT